MLSDERLAQLRARWERGDAGGWSETIDTIGEAVQTIATLLDEVERLQRQLSQLTHDIDAKGRETYRCGFEDGYAKGAGSADDDDTTE